MTQDKIESLSLNGAAIENHELEEHPVEDSLLKRYSFKVGGGVFSLPINLAIQTMVVRALGPTGYGSYSFLTNFFTQVAGFFDCGTSLCFYTNLCKRPAEKLLVSFYWRFVGVVALFICGLVLALVAIGQREIWPGQVRPYIYLAAILGIGTWILGIIEKILDAYSLSAPGEIARTLQRSVGVLLIGGLFWAGWLNLTWYFIAQLLMVGFLVFLWRRVLLMRGEELCPLKRLQAGLLKQYSTEFWYYSHPLLFYALVGMFTNIADRWLLQFFSGSIEQGFYGLSSQIGTIAFVFTAAMTPLLTREFAQAHHERDLPRMQRDFATHIPRFVTFTAFVCIFFASQAGAITSLFAGSQFSNAQNAVMLMCYYPIFQVYGQLSAAVFYATDQTGRYRDIGLCAMGFGMVLSLWLLGPKHIHCLQLGATGLAVKSLGTAVFAINTQLWFNAKFLKVSFLRFAAHQVAVVVGFTALAIGCRLIVGSYLQSIAGGLVVSGLCYTVLSAIAIYITPSVVTISRTEIHSVLRRYVFRKLLKI